MDFIEKVLYWLVVLLGGKCVLRDTSGGMAIVDNEWHLIFTRQSDIHP